MPRDRPKRKYAGKTNVRVVRSVRYRESYVPYLLLIGGILIGAALMAFSAIMFW